VSPEHQAIIKEKIYEAAVQLKGKLPPSRRHPKGRSAWAHIPKIIIDVFGGSYRSLPDDLFEEVLEVIQYCRENPF
jgi:hypothetical protein